MVNGYDSRNLYTEFSRLTPSYLLIRNMPIDLAILAHKLHLGSIARSSSHIAHSAKNLRTFARPTLPSPKLPIATAGRLTTQLNAITRIFTALTRERYSRYLRSGEREGEGGPWSDYNPLTSLPVFWMTFSREEPFAIVQRCLCKNVNVPSFGVCMPSVVISWVGRAIK